MRTGHFDGDVTVQRLVVTEINGAKSTCAQALVRLCTARFVPAIRRLLVPMEFRGAEGKALGFQPQTARWSRGACTPCRRGRLRLADVRSPSKDQGSERNSPASIVARLNRRFKMRGRTHALSESNVVQRRTCVGSDTPDAHPSLAVQNRKNSPGEVLSNRRRIEGLDGRRSTTGSWSEPLTRNR